VDKPLVQVQWWDANTGTDDVVDEDNLAGYHKPTLVTTIGWLMRQDDVGITLCNEHYDKSFRGRTFIPAAMVLPNGVQPYKSPPHPRKRRPAAPAQSPAAT
jgi:hypothetical protein